MQKFLWTKWRLETTESSVYIILHDDYFICFDQKKKKKTILFVLQLWLILQYFDIDSYQSDANFFYISVVIFEIKIIFSASKKMQWCVSVARFLVIFANHFFFYVHTLTSKKLVHWIKHYHFDRRMNLEDKSKHYH